MGDSSQLEKEFLLLRQSGQGRESVIPNPKAKLLDQVREVMRLRHYSIRTEQSYCDCVPGYSGKGLSFVSLPNQISVMPAR